MKAKIYRCSGENYWYKDMVGHTFEVEFHSRESHYKVVGKNKLISIEDTMSTKDFELKKEIDDIVDNMPTDDVYESLREFLKESNADPILMKKLYALYSKASFWD